MGCRTLRGARGVIMVLVKLFHSWKSGSNLGKGMKSSRAGNLTDALEYFQNALYHAEKTDNMGGIAFKLEIIAQTYYKMGESEKAADYAINSLDLYSQIQNMNPSGQTEDQDNPINKSVQRIKDLQNLIRTG